MPDIQLRFHHDMLVLSAPIDAALARQGVDAARDRQYLNLMEPDALQDAIKFELVAGAQCLVTTTEDITKARLAHVHMDGDASKLASAALNLANELKPQHILAEIGPCGLPLDASSKASLNESRAQYADAARAFGDGTFDAFFLNGFTNITDLKCALMGVSQVSGKPIFASVTIGEGDCMLPEKTFVRVAHDDASPIDGGISLGTLTPMEDAPAPPMPASMRKAMGAQAWPEAISVMEELGASVIGFETAEPLSRAIEYAKTAASATQLPLLAQLRVKADAGTSKLDALKPVEDIHDYTPATMDRAAIKLYGAGVQFLRATGAATPAFTGALAATVQGLDVRRTQE